MNQNILMIFLTWIAFFNFTLLTFSFSLCSFFLFWSYTEHNTSNKSIFGHRAKLNTWRNKGIHINAVKHYKNCNGKCYVMLKCPAKSLGCHTVVLTHLPLLLFHSAAILRIKGYSQSHSESNIKLEVLLFWHFSSRSRQQ